MEIKKTFELSKRKLNKNLVLADEVFNWSGGKLKRTLIAKFCNEIGWRAVYEIFQECKKSNDERRIGLFVYLINKDKKNIIK